MRKFTGEYAAAQIASVPMWYGNSLAMLSVVTDVSEQEALIRELSESDERYKTLLENMEVGVTVVVDNVFRYANTSFARILGCKSVEDVIGQSTREFVAERGWPTVRDARRQVILSGARTLCESVVLVRPDGTEVTVSLSMTRVRWDGAAATQTTLTPVEREPAE
jgi:PAS domain S-box-containing protein